jgi:hypothetical protein
MKTARERVNFHLKESSCAGCHRIMDPMGLSMESFDGAGQFRQQENGVDIDTSGVLDGAAFNDVVGLGKVLHDNSQLPWCLARRAFAYGTGTQSDSNSRPLIEYLSARFAADGYVLPDLLREIALSKAFRKVYELRAREEPALPDVKSTQELQSTPKSDLTAFVASQPQ